MTMFPGDSTFEAIKPSVFRVQISWNDDYWTGTGFAIGCLRDSRKLIIATAKHVIDLPDDATVWWDVHEYAEDGGIVRHIKFGSNMEAKGDVPYRTHKTFDVGLCALPSVDENGELFTRPNELPLRAIDPRKGVTTGTRVAWAGFPAIVENALGFPQLCYFEGVISAMINRGDGRDYYVIDGHGAPGVSGGPVWHWSVEHQRPEIIGVVSSYRHANDGLPGFCFFEPINPVLDYLEWWRAQATDDFVITQ